MTPGKDSTFPSHPAIIAAPQQRLDRLHFFSLEKAQEKIPGVYREAFPFLLRAADKMDDIFWKQAYGQKDSLLASIDDEALRKLIALNYGPYDRLDGNAPLLSGLKDKPIGANFYPRILSARELDKIPDGLRKLTIVKRDSLGNLLTSPYAVEYAEELAAAAADLRAAAERIEEGKFRNFLEERAQALLSDDYIYSDGLWLGLWDQDLDILLGPIESYEDAYKGVKSAYQACIVLKDQKSTEEIRPLIQWLPRLRLNLNKEISFEQQKVPNVESVGVYNALYFSGLFNAGSKSMGLNAPQFSFPPEVETQGKRRLILKNIVEAKFTYIAQPLGEALLDSTQRELLTIDAFFQYVLFHELSHGLQLTTSGNAGSEKSIQENLLEYASIMEEGKGDILGLYMISQAYKQNLIDAGSLESHYVTSLVNTLRSIRFGRSSDHAIANMIRFNFFLEEGAYVFDEDKQVFRINATRMEESIKKLVEEILEIQASGKVSMAKTMTLRYGFLTLKQEQVLDQYSHIPVDLRFK